MEASKDEKSPPTDVTIHTKNPVHECEFKWNIENATKFSRRLNSHEFPEESSCKPRFRIVTKFHEKYPDITNVNVGLQRIDDGKEVIHVNAEVSLVNLKGDVYRTKNLSYTSCSDGSPCYCFSELFTASKSKLTFPTSFSSEDKTEISLVKMKGLAGSYKHEDEVFLLVSDTLIVKGTIRSYGCCVLTETLPTPEIQDEFTKQTHVTGLLEDLRNAYENSLLTDVELIVAGDTIRVHRFILSLRSPVFKRMFDYETKEKISGKIHIEDVEKSVLENFVWYLYTGIVKEESWDFMCALYAVAEKYEVFPLKKACSSILTTVIDRDSVCGILVLADLYSDECLKGSAMDYITQYFSRIKSNPEWEAILKSSQNLAAEVLIAVSSESRGKLF